MPVSIDKGNPAAALKSQMHGNLVVIDDFQDPRLDPYRDVKDRDVKGRFDGFMAEGRFVIERLLTSSLAETLSVLTTPERWPHLNTVGLAPDVPVYLVKQEIMNRVIGFDLHRGYLALGRLRQSPQPKDLLRPGSLLVIALSGIANTDNMGGLFRNAAAFGVDAVILDQKCCDPFYRKALRVSMGASLCVPHIRLEKTDSLLDVLNANGLSGFALSPNKGCVLSQVKIPQRACLIFGSEGPGLDARLMEQVDRVTIPMRGDFDSLNVATASGIALHHFSNHNHTI